MDEGRKNTRPSFFEVCKSIYEDIQRFNRKISNGIEKIIEWCISILIKLYDTYQVSANFLQRFLFILIIVVIVIYNLIQPPTARHLMDGVQIDIDSIEEFTDHVDFTSRDFFYIHNAEILLPEINNKILQIQGLYEGNRVFLYHNFYYQYIRAIIYIVHGNNEAAEKSLLQCLELFNLDEFEGRRLSTELKLKALLGEVYLNLGELEKANEQFSFCVRYLEECNSLLDQFYILKAYGLYLYQIGKLQQAKKIFLKCLSLDIERVIGESVTNYFYEGTSLSELNINFVASLERLEIYSMVNDIELKISSETGLLFNVDSLYKVILYEIPNGATCRKMYQIINDISQDPTTHDCYQEMLLGFANSNSSTPLTEYYTATMELHKCKAFIALKDTTNVVSTFIYLDSLNHNLKSAAFQAVVLFLKSQWRWGYKQDLTDNRMFFTWIKQQSLPYLYKIPKDWETKMSKKVTSRKWLYSSLGSIPSINLIVIISLFLITFFIRSLLKVFANFIKKEKQERKEQELQSKVEYEKQQKMLLEERKDFTAQQNQKLNEEINESRQREKDYQEAIEKEKRQRKILEERQHLINQEKEKLLSENTLYEQANANKKTLSDTITFKDSTNSNNKRGTKLPERALIFKNIIAITSPNKEDKKSRSNYRLVHFTEDERYYILETRETLTSILNRLPERYFVQINRGVIIAFNFLDFQSLPTLKLKEEAEINMQLSPNFKPKFRIRKNLFTQK